MAVIDSEDKGVHLLPHRTKGSLVVEARMCVMVKLKV